MGYVEGSRRTIFRMVLRGVIGLFLASVFACPTFAGSLPPASPAQLQALSDQIAGLQAQQQAAAKDLADWQALQQGFQKKLAADQAKLQDLLNPISIGAQAGMDKLRGVDKTATGGDMGLQILDAKNAVDNDNKVINASADNAAESRQKIDALGKQINDLQATLQDLQNPAQIQKALDDENAHKASLNNPTGDDAGQLGWDSSNTDARINELQNRLGAIRKLESDFQQSGPGGSSGASGGQSGQQQSGSYTTPTQSTGTSPQPGQPQPVFGYPPPDSPSSRVPFQTLIPTGGKTANGSSGSGSDTGGSSMGGGCPG